MDSSMENNNENSIESGYIEVRSMNVGESTVDDDNTIYFINNKGAGVKWNMWGFKNPDKWKSLSSGRHGGDEQQ